MLYIVLAVTTILIVSKLLTCNSWKGKDLRILALNRTMLSWVGGISLEVYLLHVQFVLNPLQRMHLGYWPTFLLTLVISLPIAWMFSIILLYDFSERRTTFLLFSPATSTVSEQSVTLSRKTQGYC